MGGCGVGVLADRVHRPSQSSTTWTTTASEVSVGPSDTMRVARSSYRPTALGTQGHSTTSVSPGSRTWWSLSGQSQSSPS